MTSDEQHDQHDDQHDRATDERPGAKQPESGSNERLPGAPNPDDQTPLGDSDQHSEVSSQPSHPSR